MRIAFVGKGGSGKTTMTSLFSLFAEAKTYKVLIFDVDVNNHLYKLFNGNVPETKVLSYKNNPTKIRKFLIGKNKRLKLDEFIKTTPPGKGSNFLELKKGNYVIDNFSTRLKKNVYVINSGSYVSEKIGVMCIHGAHAVVENLLWFSKFGTKDLMLLDSTAGVDHFGNTLFYQDLLVFVAKPTRDSLDVFENFLKLAKAAGREKNICLVVNQVKTANQIEFAMNAFPVKPIGIISEQEEMIDIQLEGFSLDRSHVTKEIQVVFERIMKLAKKNTETDKQRLRALVEMHRKLSSRPSWQKTYRPGLDDQIDPGYLA